MEKETRNLFWSLNSFFLKVLVILPFCGWAYLSQAQTECDQLVWDQHRQLQWIDFKGEYDSTVLVYETLPDAVSVVFIEIVIDSLNNYKALAKFDQCKSWVRIKSDEILNHEIGHFNIEELFARELQVILDQNQNNYNFNIDSLYHVVNLKCKEGHKLYDKRTLFGTRDDVQKFWTDSLSNQLHFEMSCK